jgi:hypothetical protein
MAGYTSRGALTKLLAGHNSFPAGERGVEERERGGWREREGGVERERERGVEERERERARRLKGGV